MTLSLRSVHNMNFPIMNLNLSIFIFWIDQLLNNLIICTLYNLFGYFFISRIGVS